MIVWGFSFENTTFYNVPQTLFLFCSHHSGRYIPHQGMAVYVARLGGMLRTQVPLHLRSDCCKVKLGEYGRDGITLKGNALAHGKFWEVHRWGFVLNSICWYGPL